MLNQKIQTSVGTVFAAILSAGFFVGASVTPAIATILV